MPRQQAISTDLGEAQPTAVLSASPRALASSGVSATTSRPPPSRGTRITMPRPSLVTSSGPSPVRGFIAAILLPFPALGPHRTATAGTTRRTAPGGTPASHMHLDQSLYYPVFGRPMVTISVPALSSPILGENRTPGAYPRP